MARAKNSAEFITANPSAEVAVGVAMAEVAKLCASVFSKE
jgi:hypothetical protein